ncbi:MAG: hypothetical protein HY037_06220 [Nitrospirae bacterium]|nr:hypothetical protein [Candidatus Troglogloeales bacterium]
MLLVARKISQEKLSELAHEGFLDLVKGVVDIRLRIMALGGELHADEEAFLIERGSLQDDLWGINIYPDKPFPESIEFDSVMNIRPRLGNRSRGVTDKTIREKVIEIVKGLIQ